MIVLGQQVRCRITGYRGIVIARSEYLYSSPQVRVQSETVNDSGLPKDAVWLDEEQCESVDSTPHIPNFKLKSDG